MGGKTKGSATMREKLPVRVSGREILHVVRSSASDEEVFLALQGCDRLPKDNKIGITLLHLLAATGRYTVVDWLLDNVYNCLGLNSVDVENGWTALHFAFYFGHISTGRLLLEAGCSSFVIDADRYSAVDSLILDRPGFICFDSGPRDVYTWGENANFNLGQQKERCAQPDCVDIFRDKQLSILKVCITRFHSVFLTDRGRVFACGHGRGGRLGTGSDDTIVIPKEVAFPQKGMNIVDIAAASHHSLFLSDTGFVYWSGSNSAHQVGLGSKVGPISPTANTPFQEMTLVPQLLHLKSLKGCGSVIGVRAGRFHSVVWTEKAVFTFGLNAGQMGHEKVERDTVKMQPRQIAALNNAHVRQVECSDAATGVLTEERELWLFFDFQGKRIVHKSMRVERFAMCGGKLDHKVSNAFSGELATSEHSELIAVMVVGGTQDMLIWRESRSDLRRVVMHVPRSLRLRVSHLCIALRTICFSTPDGRLFTGTLSKSYQGADAESTDSPNSLRANQNIVGLSQSSLTGGSSPKTLTNTGTAPAAVISPRTAINASKKRQAAISSTTSSLTHLDVEHLQIKRVLNADRVCTSNEPHHCSIVMAPTARSFAVVQSRPCNCITDLPLYQNVTSTLRGDLLSLLKEAHCQDSVHDVIAKVGAGKFALHSYVLAARSKLFASLIQRCRKELLCSDEACILDLSEWCRNPVLMEHLLIFIYSGSCEFVRSGTRVKLERALQLDSAFGNGLADDDFSVRISDFADLPSPRGLMAVGDEQPIARQLDLSVADYVSDADLARVLHSISIEEARPNMSTPRNKQPKSKKGRKGSSKKQQEKSKTTVPKKAHHVNGATDVMLTPLAEFQALAKSFGIHSLCKQLDQIEWCDAGYVNKKKYLEDTFGSSDGVQAAADQLLIGTDGCSISSTLLPDLRDVVIESTEGEQFPAHKCILVARFEYFRSIFSTGIAWEESSARSTFKLNLPSKVIESILVFAYSDVAPTVTGTNVLEVEHVWAMMAAADQLLIDSLKLKCQIVLASQLSLRNAADTLELSQMYNAPELARTAAQFICINLGTLFAKGSLGVLNEESLEVLDEYYATAFAPDVLKRRSDLTRGCVSPYDELRTLFEEARSLALDLTHLQRGHPFTQSGSSPKSPSSSRATTPLSSCGSPSIESSSLDETSPIEFVEPELIEYRAAIESFDLEEYHPSFLDASVDDRDPRPDSLPPTSPNRPAGATDSATKERPRVSREVSMIRGNIGSTPSPSSAVTEAAPVGPDGDIPSNPKALRKEGYLKIISGVVLEAETDVEMPAASKLIDLRQLKRHDYDEKALEYQWPSLEVSSKAPSKNVAWSQKVKFSLPISTSSEETTSSASVTVVPSSSPARNAPISPGRRDQTPLSGGGGIIPIEVVNSDVKQARSVNLCDFLQPVMDSAVAKPVSERRNVDHRPVWGGAGMRRSPSAQSAGVTFEDFELHPVGAGAKSHTAGGGVTTADNRYVAQVQSFSSIVQEQQIEAAEIAERSRPVSKPLHLIQIEEEAIAALSVRYEKARSSDFTVSIERTKRQPVKESRSGHKHKPRSS